MRTTTAVGRRRVIRVDPEVRQATIDIQAKLMVATGHFVSTNDAIKFFLSLKEYYGEVIHRGK